MHNIPAETDELLKSSTDPEGTEDVNLGHFLKAFFDQVPAILYIKDEAGRYVKINPSLRKDLPGDGPASARHHGS